MNVPGMWIGTAILLTILFSLSPGAAEQDTLYQVSTYDLLESGDYGGIIPVEELILNGTIGIGTFDNLDGELTMLDGVVYQITADGMVSEVPGNETIPFANAVFFEPSDTFTLRDLNRSALEEAILSRLPDTNVTYAIRIDGIFSEVIARSVPGQTEPYPALPEVLEDQSVFNLTNTSGSVIGFWFPDRMQGINYAGYHFHYLNDARDAGGHVLDLILENGTVGIDPIGSFSLTSRAGQES